VKPTCPDCARLWLVYRRQLAKARRAHRRRPIYRRCAEHDKPITPGFVFALEGRVRDVLEREYSKAMGAAVAPFARLLG
jgi:hypothetical protein